MPDAVTVDLAAYIAGKAETGSLNINLGEGQPPVRLLPPELWGDDAIEVIQSGASLREQGIAILGADEYARFEAAGGNARLLDALIRDRHELSAPESEASSDS